MLSLSSLPPEIRLMIYKLFVQEAISGDERVVARPDALETATTTISLLYKRERCDRQGPKIVCEFFEVPMSSPLSHYVCFGPLLSLAKASKPFYQEISPVIWNRANYTVQGSLTGMYTMLQAHLPVLSTTAIDNIVQLNIVAMDAESTPKGAGLVKQIVEFVNDHLPNLKCIRFNFSEPSDVSAPASTIEAQAQKRVAIVGALMLVPSHVELLLGMHPSSGHQLELFQDRIYATTIISIELDLEIRLRTCKIRGMKRQIDQLTDSLVESLEKTIYLRLLMFGCLKGGD